MSRTKSMAKYSAMITIALICSKAVGLIRESLIASYFGATRTADIYKIATNIPQLFYGCIGAALTVSFIPIFSNVKNDREKANEFFSNILNIIFLICALLALVGMFFSTQLSELMANGFTQNQIAQTSNLTKIVMPSIIFLSINGLYTGYLQSHDIFLQPALTSIIANFVIIIGIVVFYKYGVTATAIAYLIGSILQLFVQRPFMKGYKYKPIINLKDENIKKMLILSVPIILSTAVGRINMLISNRYASALPEGSIAIISNATLLTSLINQVFIVSITTVYYPKLTDKFTNGDRSQFVNMVLKALNMVIIIVIPLVLGLFTLSEPVIKLMFEHGEFTREATRITSLCIKYLVFSAIGYSIMDITGKVFFSSKDTLTPMIVGFIQIAINIALIIVLTPRYGINGLVSATTIAVSIVALIMLIVLKKKIKTINYLNTIGIVLKTSISAIVMALAVKFAYTNIGNMFNFDGTFILLINICVSTLIGVIVYAFMLKILKVKELNDILSFEKLK